MKNKLVLLLPFLAAIFTWSCEHTCYIDHETATFYFAFCAFVATCGILIIISHLHKIISDDINGVK